MGRMRSRRRATAGRRQVPTPSLTTAWRQAGRTGRWGGGTGRMGRWGGGAGRTGRWGGRRAGWAGGAGGRVIGRAGCVGGVYRRVGG